MNIRIKLSSVLLIVAALILFLASYTSLASAVGEEKYSKNFSQSQQAAVMAEPVPGGPGYVSINGATFIPASNTVDWAVFAGEIYNPSLTENGSYFAPVLLPQGAIVTQFVIYYNDNSALNLNVNLYRKTLLPDLQQMAQISSQYDVGFGTAVDYSIFNATVDNQSYSYIASLYIPPATAYDLSLVGVRVDYSFPSYIPMVSK